MGIDPAPFWANLHLYSYECAFITGLMSTDKGRAMKFRYATRFIDDECNLNDDDEFGRSFVRFTQTNWSLSVNTKVLMPHFCNWTLPSETESQYTNF